MTILERLAEAEAVYRKIADGMPPLYNPLSPKQIADLLGSVRRLLEKGGEDGASA
jgi:hypothetical protein